MFFMHDVSSNPQSKVQIINQLSVRVATGQFADSRSIPQLSGIRDDLGVIFNRGRRHEVLLLRRGVWVVIKAVGTLAQLE